MHETHKELRKLHLFTKAVAVFTGIVPRKWAAVRRKRHHFSDHEGDPHSPILFGMCTVLFGNYFFYKKETANPETVRKYTPDRKDDLLDKIPALRHGILIGLGPVIGYRNFDEQATNLQWVAMLTGGEGLHNNHHADANSIRHGP
jgi:stearoyl-CoA desaturase (delta-9 desaturase)